MKLGLVSQLGVVCMWFLIRLGLRPGWLEYLQVHRDGYDFNGINKQSKNTPTLII